MIQKIKTCPFCNEEPNICVNDDGMFYIECSGYMKNCGVVPSSLSYKTKTEVIEAWNQRA